MKLFQPKTIWLPTWQGWIFLFLLFVGLFLGAVWNVHRILIVTNRVVNADILVVEAWVPDVILQAAAKEFKEGNYRHLLIGDIREDKIQKNIKKSSAVDRIVTLGVPRNHIVECHASATDHRQSAAMAIAVRDTLRQEGIATKGVNIITAAAHARKTWLVYRRVLVSEASVGIIAVPTGDYDPERWWRTTQGAKWVIGNSIGLVYEWLSGP